jgi:hypothetical protein
MVVADMSLMGVRRRRVDRRAAAVAELRCAEALFAHSRLDVVAAMACRRLAPTVGTR